jgi:hypothetical protein
MHTYSDGLTDERLTYGSDDEGEPCPECGGAGVVQAQQERTVPICCGRPRRDGSCCGNVVPGLEVDICEEPCWTCGRPDKSAPSEGGIP